MILGLEVLTLAKFAKCKEDMKIYLLREDVRAWILALPNERLPLAPPYLGQVWASIIENRLCEASSLPKDYVTLESQIVDSPSHIH